MSCDRPGILGTCVQNLALGYITSADLCGGCTRLMMTALDQASPEPLKWHEAYHKRAGTEPQ